MRKESAFLGFIKQYFAGKMRLDAAGRAEREKILVVGVNSFGSAAIEGAMKEFSEHLTCARVRDSFEIDRLRRRLARGRSVDRIIFIVVDTENEADVKIALALAGAAKARREVVVCIAAESCSESARTNAARMRAKFDALLSVNGQSLQEAVRQFFFGICSIVASQNTGHVSFDFVDLKMTLSDAGDIFLGIGSGSYKKRAENTLTEVMNVLKILKHMPFPAAEKAKRFLILFTTNDCDVGVVELSKFAETVRNEYGYKSEDSLLFWGHSIDDALEEEIRLFVLAADLV